MEKGRASDVQETPVSLRPSPADATPGSAPHPHTSSSFSHSLASSPSEKEKEKKIDDDSRPASIASVKQEEAQSLDTYEDLERAIAADDGDSDDDDEEEEDGEAIQNVLTHIRTATSICSSASRPPDYEVTFEPGDPEDPRNWSVWYRSWTIGVLSYSNWVIVLYSTSYTAGIPGLIKDFNVSTPVATLGLTTYLLGLAAGSLVVAPLSELYGRQKVYLCSMVASLLLIIPCALAKTLTEMIVVRFFGYVIFFVVSLPAIMRVHLDLSACSLSLCSASHFLLNKADVWSSLLSPRYVKSTLRLRLHNQQSGLHRRHQLRKTQSSRHVPLVHRAPQRPRNWPLGRRLHLSVPRLAVEQLDRADAPGLQHAPSPNAEGNLRADHSPAEDGEEAEGDG